MDAYHSRFEAAVAAAILGNGPHFGSAKLLAYETGANDSQQPEAAAKLVHAGYLAMVFLKNADPTRFSGLWAQLDNSMLLGRNEFPRNMPSSYDLLCHFQSVDTPDRTERENAEVSFAQTQVVLPPPTTGDNGRTEPRTRCFICNLFGHAARFCPSGPPRDGVQGLQFGVTLAQADPESSGTDIIISPDWLLLDSGSTVSSVCNVDLITNLRKSKEVMHVISNGGSQDYDAVGTLKLFPFNVYFNPKSLANILSLAQVQNMFRVTMDTAEEPTMMVHLSDDLILKFTQCGSGLYYYDVKENSATVNSYSFLSTVRSNKDYFNRKEIEGADKARLLQGNIGWPSTQDLKELIASNQIINCSVTVADVNRAEAIYGPQVPLLKGKMVRRRPEHIVNVPRVPISTHILKHHPTDEINMDFMFVNGAPYLHTKSTVVKFLSVQYCTGRGRKEMERGIDKVTSKFTQRGFDITAFNGDNEFEKLREHVSPTPLNIVGRGEHVGTIERSVRTIKERVRCSCQGIPYKRITKLMTRSIVESSVTWLNAFPAKEGVSKTMSPSAIVLGSPKPDYNKLKLTFGAYAQVYESTTNTTQSRSTGAIALKPSNERGGYYFMSLSTGRRLHCSQWTELPIPDYVIDRVEELARQEKQPVMTNGHPIFEWSPGVPILDEDELEGEDFEDDELENGSFLYENTENEEFRDYDDASDDDSDNVDGAGDDDTDDAAVDDVVTVIATDAAAAENVIPVGLTELDEQPVQPEPRNDGRPSRSHEATTRNHYVPGFKGNSYEMQFLSASANKQAVWADDCYRIAVDVMFTQMTAAKGIKLFGEKAIAVMFKEYNQLNDMTVFGRTDPDKLSPKQKKGALRAVNLIKEKRCGRLKGRACADGSKQRAYIPREEATSPTVSMEALTASLVIDAHEKRAVAIFDVPGAYLNADMPEDKFVILKLEGQFVDIMCKVNPEYLKDVRFEYGKKTLYLRVLKALYGCIESALLWYNLYVSTLKDMGFVINPYDRCVANTVIDGSQCTILWYVDDNKLSHMSENVVTSIVGRIKKHFGDLVISRGKEHTFLGMNIKFNDNGSLQIEMKKYIEEAIESFGEDVSKNVASAATKMLFEVDASTKVLDVIRADIFHSVVAKLLWVMKRSRPDIETAISFLCTRVSRSDEDDWAKLKRLLQFLRQTIDDVRVIAADDLSKLLTWVDASYAIHHDMRGHTGGAMSFGTGIIHGKASKQKLNTKSSTETEVVGASDYLPYNIWMRHFMEAQGYSLKNNVYYQDNQSAMKMEKNGRNSCTGNSRHINIRYFFIKDQVDAKKLEIMYCPTGQMLADYFTKPLQGKLFHMFREVIMGWKHIDTLKEVIQVDSSSLFKERVGGLNISNDETKERLTYAQVVKGSAKNDSRGMPLTQASRRH